MTETSLQPSWPSSQFHNMYCLLRLGGCLCTIPGKTAIHFILLQLVQPTLVTVQRAMYTIWWKANCTVSLVAKDAWYCLYWLQSLTKQYARNSKKNNYALW